MTNFFNRSSSKNEFRTWNLEGEEMCKLLNHSHLKIHIFRMLSAAFPSSSFDFFFAESAATHILELKRFVQHNFSGVIRNYSRNLLHFFFA